MELILLKDIENLGFKNDLVTVKDGYGRNYLIPQKLATMATPSAKKVLSETLRQGKKKEEGLVNKANTTAETIKGMSLRISAKTGHDGKLFGSVTNTDISNSLEKQNVFIEKKFIKIAGGSVKRVGKYVATIRLHREVQIEVSFDVVPQTK
ncbi:50S ribosomal protein L9 [Elysia marginata]|uniref:Large ribosomal subunit protein bL9m n=1 Tax=Elysia marginata TaxID=1093978 RepID=A0AAV4I1F5_9GAST|nr:50S ribosomal protein L9 [Elysia marginata]